MGSIPTTGRNGWRESKNKVTSNIQKNHKTATELLFALFLKGNTKVVEHS